ncbi:MAG: stage III sporulation protein AG [Lachnospiraceae bacterium]|nr:stage III sporulation protein AG [Lachnospiraceae bacterium]
MKALLEQIGIQKGIILLAAGIFLIILSFPNTQKDESEQTDSSEEQSEEDASVELLEQRLVKILSKVDGVGSVKVMITLKSSKETVVNKDTPYEEEEEKDGNSTKKSVSKQEETVLVEENGESVPYVVKELEPEIEGVVVIAKGGNSASVQKNITEAVTALFDVPAHKVKVLKMEDDS